MLNYLLSFFRSKRGSEILLAKIQVQNPKTGELVLKKTESPFFPESWDRAKTERAIQWAAIQGKQLTDGQWEGIYDGVKIIGRSNSEKVILQAYPQFH